MALFPLGKTGNSTPQRKGADEVGKKSEGGETEVSKQTVTGFLPIDI